MIDLKAPQFLNSKYVQNQNLKEEEIYIWVLSLPELKSYFDILYSFLNQEEKDKASLFRSRADQTRYIMTRGGLRYLLGGYIGKKPEEVDITYNKWGKPQISNLYSLNFSLSHSVDYSLIAFTKSCDIGIDIEFINPDLNLDELVTVFINQSELDCWKRIPSKLKTEYFYKLWVGKEVFLKALGKGWLEQEEIINKITILPHELNQCDGILKTHYGVIHYLNIISDYECAYFSKNFSLKPRVFNLK